MFEYSHGISYPDIRGPHGSIRMSARDISDYVCKAWVSPYDGLNLREMSETQASGYLPDQHPSATKTHRRYFLVDIPGANAKDDLSGREMIALIICDDSMLKIYTSMRSGPARARMEQILESFWDALLATTGPLVSSTEECFLELKERCDRDNSSS